MNQIPVEGKFCENCPCLGYTIGGIRTGMYCWRYEDFPIIDKMKNHERILDCIKERPQITTKEE
uniref:Uncharacterized protein n=1 Tax=viral metagenome TaxID=1070528 RepID=A0A6M3L6C1_9ZZZZ